MSWILLKETEENCAEIYRDKSLMDITHKLIAKK